jgi:hypothetical protein
MGCASIIFRSIDPQGLLYESNVWEKTLECLKKQVDCHPERSEGSHPSAKREMLLRFAHQHDKFFWGSKWTSL